LDPYRSRQHTLSPQRPTHEGVPLVSGCAGVVAGLVVLFHERVDDVVAQSVLFSLLGIVILLTGLAHVLGGFTTGDELARQLSRSSILLGMMEIALGLLFLLGSLENSRAAYWAAGIWALTGGVILIGDALLLRRRLRDHKTGCTRLTSPSQAAAQARRMTRGFAGRRG
jgi:uncharacterized membrane protein HdeD (DUF308 family)